MINKTFTNTQFCLRATHLLSFCWWAVCSFGRPCSFPNTAEPPLIMNTATSSPTSMVTTVPGTCPAYPTFSSAPANESITNSICVPGCTLSGGVITAPGGTPCPAGSILQYQVNGGSWTTNLPEYDQDGPVQSIKTRCSCSTNDMINSVESVAVSTAPGACVPIASSSISVTETSGTTNNDGIICSGANVVLSANATGELDQNQESFPTCLANVTQADLAQSFKPAANVICGAGVYFRNNYASTLTIRLYTNLPNAGGVLLAQGTASAPGAGWLDVSWPSVSVTPGTTYYLVFSVNSNISQCLGGNTSNPYPDGQTYANSGYQSYPGLDYTFRTYACLTSADYLWSTTETTAQITASPAGTTTYTVSVTNSTGCISTASTTINVTPTLNAVATPSVQTICSGNAITTIALSGNVPGTTYNWMRDNTASVTGIATSGSGDISGNLINTTNAPVTVTFTITPTGNSCPVTPITATVLVNPTPLAVTIPTAQTICNNSNTNIALSSNVPGTTFSWIVHSTTGTVSGQSGGNGTIIGQTLANSGATAATVTYRITPTSPDPGICVGPTTDVTVMVAPSPAITCPGPMFVNSSTDGTGNCSGAAIWTHPTIAAGPCGPIVLTLSIDGGAPVTVTPGSPALEVLSVGQHTMTYVVSDGKMPPNTATCSFTVTVIDDESPSITCPPPRTYSCDESTAPVQLVLLDEDFSDNSAGWTLGNEWQIGPAVGGCGDPDTDHSPSTDNGIAGVVIGGCASTAALHGYYYLTSPVIDASYAGNDLTLSYWRYLWSDYAPYMKNIVQVFDGVAWQTIWETFGSPETRDNSWVLQSFNIAAYKNPMLQVRFGFNVGSAGVISRGSWNLDDIVITASEIAFASDNCGNSNLTISYSDTPGSACQGCTLINRIWTATDASNNSNECIQVLTIVDNEMPTITCPATQTLALGANCTATVPDYTGLATTGDNCGVQSVTQSPTAGTTVSGVGDLTVTLTVTDVNDNPTQCSFTVTKVDETPPTITCPGTQTLALGANCTATLPDYIGLSTPADNCVVQSVTQFPAAGTPVTGAGNMTVTLTVTDGNNLTNTCTFTVTEVDNTPPTIVCREGSIQLQGAQYTLAAADVLNLAAGSDNCGQMQVTNISPAQVGCDHIGQTIQVQVTATDGNGNNAVCTASILVNKDSALPPGWTAANVGATAAGSSSYDYCENQGEFTLSANGYTTNTTDVQHSVYQSLCGNGELIAHVSGISPQGGWAGLQMRESTSQGSKKFTLKTQLNAILRREARSATFGPTNTLQMAVPPSHTWLRITRAGNVFTAYSSADGINWAFRGTATIAMNSCLQVGLFVESINNTITTEAVFDNVWTAGGIMPMAAPVEGGVETIHEYSLRAFPNPTTGEVHIDLAQYMGRPVRLEVYSLEGRLIRFADIEEAQSIEQLDLSTDEPGVYLLKVLTANKTVVTKRIVLSGK